MQKYARSNQGLPYYSYGLNVLFITIVMCIKENSRSEAINKSEILRKAKYCKNYRSRQMLAWLLKLADVQLRVSHIDNCYSILTLMVQKLRTQFDTVVLSAHLRLAFAWPWLDLLGILWLCREFRVCIQSLVWHCASSGLTGAILT